MDDFYRFGSPTTDVGRPTLVNGGETRKQHGAPSKLNRIDESCSLRRPWLNNILERRGLTRRNYNHRNQWLAYENSPNRSGRVTGLGLDHIPGAINIFLNVKHRQRHRTGNP